MVLIKVFFGRIMNEKINYLALFLENNVMT